MVNVIDYMPGDTLLHRLNPVIKLGLAATIIIGIFLSDTYVALLGFLALTLALGAYAGVVDRLLALLKLLIPLALIMLVLQLAFMRDATWCGALSPMKAHHRNKGLSASAGRGATAYSDAHGDQAQRPCQRLRRGAARSVSLRLHLYHGAALCASVWPGDERIMEAQTARGIEYDTKNPIKKLKLMLPLCVPLLISSVGKTDATALAAEQRGFYLRTRASSYKRYPIKGLDIAILIVSIALIVLGFLF